MTHGRCLEYLKSLQRFGIKLGLDNIRALLGSLGNPDRRFPSALIAGTNGKGSVAAMLARILSEHGFRTGLYTSPHLVRVEERIRIGDDIIPEKDFCRALSAVREGAERLLASGGLGHPSTFFEVLTAAALAHFAEEAVDFAVLEVGMGGRFDATNAVTPLLAVITTVSLDHQKYLGRTLGEIAFEKAGIIKKGKPAVVGYQRYSILPVLERKAAEEGSRLYRTESLCRYDLRRLSSKGSLFDAVVDGISLEKLFLSLPGRHQVENAVTVLLGLKVLDLLPPADGVRATLTQIRFPTRLELFEGQVRVRSGSGGGMRRVLLDSAHNEDSARVLVEALREAYRYGRLFTILGIVKGKDVRGIVQNLAPVSDELIVTEPKTHKELDTERVVSEARSLKPSALFIPDIRDAIEHAVSVSNADDLILVTGSFYATSPARSYLLRAFGPV